MREYAVFRHDELHGTRWYGYYEAATPEEAVRKALADGDGLPEHLWDTAWAAGHVAGYSEPDQELLERCWTDDPGAHWVLVDGTSYVALETRVTVLLDARRDLYEAGKCTCDECVAAFARAYEAAARRLEEERGLEIRVVHGRYDGLPPTGYQPSEFERWVWQELHYAVDDVECPGCDDPDCPDAV